MKLFRDVVQFRSVTRGAAVNGVTASAASQHLQELERSLDAVLLDRTTRPFQVTDAGKLYFELCREVLRRNDEFMAALGNLKGAVNGTVKVASIYSVGLSEMSQIEGQFKARYPEVVLEVEYLRPERVYEAVSRETADIGLVSYPEPRKDVAVIPWRREEMVLAVGPAHSLAGMSRILTERLDGLDFVAFDEDLPIRREVDRYLKDRGVEVRVVMHFDNLQTIKEAVALGPGVSIVPARILRTEMEQGRLKAIRLDAPLYRPLGILHRKKKRFSRAAAMFLQLLQESTAGQPAGALV